MRIITGDLWEQDGIKVIPTNLSVNGNGHVIMGRGVAKQATEKYPWVQRFYGEWIQKHYDFIYQVPCAPLICVPVKEKWDDKAQLTIISNGLRQLSKTYSKLSPIYLPLLGCGFGELDEQDVCPLMKTILREDRFVLVLRDNTVKEKYPASFRRGARRDKSFT